MTQNRHTVIHELILVIVLRETNTKKVLMRGHDGKPSQRNARLVILDSTLGTGQTAL